MRILVFGRIGNEDWPPSEKHRIFEQRRGTNEEVAVFLERWLEIDENGNGEIEFDELIGMLRKGADRCLVTRIVRYFTNLLSQERFARSGDLARDSSERRGSVDMSATRSRPPRGAITKEDMMRLLWLKAMDDDIAEMNAFFDLRWLQNASVSAPPVLPKKKRQELWETFRDLDTDRRGTVSYNELVDAGLIDDDMCRELKEKYDTDNDGIFDFDEYLIMLCPYGFRAHKGITQGITKQGQMVKLVKCQLGSKLEFQGWLSEETLSLLDGQYDFEFVE